MPEPFLLSQEPACAREEPRGSVTRSSSLINRCSQRHRRPPSRHGQGTAAVFAITSWKAAWSESASRNVSAVFTIIFLRIWHGAWHEVSAYYIFVEYLLHLHRMLIGSKGDKTPYKRVIKEFCAPTKNPKLISMY